MQHAGLAGSFARIDRTHDDVSLAVNGVHVMRVPYDGSNNVSIDFSGSEVEKTLACALGAYSDSKVAALLNYIDGEDYRLPGLSGSVALAPVTNPYYVYYKVMGMKDQDVPKDVSPAEVLAKKKEAAGEISKYGFKRLKREIEAASAPLKENLKGRVPGDVIDEMVDIIAQRYSPEASRVVQEAVGRITHIFQDLYKRSKSYGILMPQDDQLITFFSQVTERVFGENTDPLTMFVVACPRYGEHDEYDRLEEGLSQTANTYLYSLPLLTTTLANNGIPYRGFVLVNDTEEQMAGGALLQRLGLTKDTYTAKCRGNVEAINQAIAQDERIIGVSAHLFTEVFPEFIDVTARLERQLYRLSQNDADFKLAIAKVADARLSRHTKIMGGTCDFSDSFYLALHYSAEYMALGYLCRSYSNLQRNSFIVNYNSPNVEQFNSKDLLRASIKGSENTEIDTVPVFQVKFY